MPLTIYTSSAGSGKTYTLVREYIKLLIANPNAYRHILAITFTNKATDEMKARIIDALSRLANYVHGQHNDPKTALLAQDILDNLTEQTLTHDQLRVNAEKALYNILHNYSEFSVSTIDSFFQKILRHFAKELKIPVRYELEMNTGYAIEQVVLKLMADIGKVEGLTYWLEQFTFAQMDEGRGWKIEHGIKEMGGEIFKEQVWERLAQGDRDFLNDSTQNDNDPTAAISVIPDPALQIPADTNNSPAHNSDAMPNSDMSNEPAKHDLQEARQPTPPNEPHNDAANEGEGSASDPLDRYQNLQNLIKQLRTIRRDFEQTMKNYGSEALELIRGYNLEHKDFKPGTVGWFEKICNGDYERKATIAKIIAGNTDEWRAKGALHRERIDQLVQNGLQQLLLDAVNFHDTNETQYYSALVVLKSIYESGILSDVQEKLKDYRSENNTMLIADTNNILRAIISQDDAPFIFEKVGNTYQHILIDEFQDTSDFQWLNLLPLVRNSLSLSQQTLVVGDAKQSIYRWRSGNMKLLLTGIKEQLNAFFDSRTEQNLANNYRSHARVIEFNNAFFDAAAKILADYADVEPHYLSDLNRAYQAVQQGIVKKSGGYVEVAFMASGGKGDGNEGESNWKAAAEQHLWEVLNNLQNDGFKYSDIAILTRRNTEGSEIAQLLAQQNIRVISSESLLLAQSAKVQLLISAMHYIADRRKHIARAEILVNYTQLFPHKNEANFTYHQLCHDHKIKQDHARNEWLKKQQNIANNSPAPQNETDETHDNSDLFDQLLPADFTQHIDDFAARNLYDCVETLIQAFDLAQDADAYLQRFQDLALEHTTRKNATLNTFLLWWHEHENSSDTSIIVPQGENAITIMTVHKAKGLEFPVVIMPYCDWTFNIKNGTKIWVQTDQKPFDQLGIIPIVASAKLEKTYFESAYHQEIAMTLIDNLNVLYVAFTRPTQRLYIMTKAITKAGVSVKSASALLYETLCQFDYAQDFDIENNLFTYGTPQAPTHTQNNEHAAQPLIYPISRHYENALFIRKKASNDPALLDEKQSEARQIGNKVHKVLEKLHQPQDLEKTMRQLQTQGLIEEKDMPIIQQRISNIFNLPEVQHWFDPNAWDEILCEQVILHYMERKIPDRIMIKGKNAIIVDYKTGLKQDKYKGQINRYAKKLRAMGYNVTAQYLLYIGDKDTEIVPCSADDTPQIKK
jgi:ATP-dependent helicase/nuclease subunit A